MALSKQYTPHFVEDSAVMLFGMLVLLGFSYIHGSSISTSSSFFTPVTSSCTLVLNPDSSSTYTVSTQLRNIEGLYRLVALRDQGLSVRFRTDSVWGAPVYTLYSGVEECLFDIISKDQTPHTPSVVDLVSIDCSSSDSTNDVVSFSPLVEGSAASMETLDTTSVGSSDTDIGRYQIALWLSIVLVLITYAAVIPFAFMENKQDALLFTRFGN